MLRRTLAAEPGLDVVGVAKDGESAVEMAAKLDPDAVIMDIELLGEMDGIDAAGHRNSHPVHAQRPPLRLQPTSERNPRWAYLLEQNVPDMASVLRRSRAVWTAWWFWTLRLSRAYNRNKAPQQPG